MKRLLLLCLLIAGTCDAQTIPITVTSVTDTVNVGDSVKINFTWYHDSNNMARIQLWTSTYLQDCMYVYWGDLATYNTDLDGTTYIKVKIVPAMGSGPARIYSNATPGNYKLFFIKSPVGIEEHFKSFTGEKQYYSLTGNRIEKRTNELIIEQAGNYRRKIYIKE